MARTPRYRLHKPSGKAFVECKKLFGSKRHYLPGLHESPESLAAYDEIKSLVAAMPKVAPVARKPGQTTVALVALEYLAHCRRSYPTGSTEPEQIARAIAPLAEMYGLTQAAAFGPVALEAVRDAMVLTGNSRKYINHQIDRIRGVFKWAASKEMIPATTYTALMTLDRLKAGRTAAKELPPVRSVAWTDVEPLLPFLPKILAAAVQVLWYSGCRLSELLTLRGCDLDRFDKVWVYRPPRHKRAHADEPRAICFGPKARAQLKPYLLDDPQAYVFTPARAWKEICERRAAGRKTKAYGKALTAKPKPRRFCPRYNARAFAHALRYGWLAMARAKKIEGRPAKGESLEAWLAANGITGYWHAHQLRHSRGTLTRANPKWGLEGSQALLGHATVNATELYAEKSLAVAMAISKATG